jgi:AcrR family transcriptional regulator
MRLSKARKACVEAMMKDTIFDAAGAVLEEKGTEGLTMDRVASKVGVATASLYNYFRDKNELLQYTHNRIVEPFFQAVEEVVKVNAPAPHKLSRIVQTALEHCANHKGLVMLLARMGYQPEIKDACCPRFVQILTTVFEQGTKEGSFRPLDATDLSRMFQGSLMELFDLQASGAAGSHVQRFADTLIDAALNGVHVAKSFPPGQGSAHSSNP